MKGFFISFEGFDGCGKTTQINLLERYLTEKGYEVLVTREPGGTSIGEQIRDIALSPKSKNMDKKTEALLYLASRIQHLNEVILPAINENKIVLCDRFIDSSIAYQGFGRELGFDYIYNLNKSVIGENLPIITLFLDIDFEVGIKRKKSQKNHFLDRMELEKFEFHKRVYDGYKHICRTFPYRIKTINANDSIIDVQKNIEKLIDNLIGEEYK